MNAAAVLPHQSAWCQRWHHRRHTWVPRRLGGFDARRYTVTDVPETTARAFVLRHHYAASWPAACHRFGLIDSTDGSLCGVLVLGIPMHPNVLLRPFPDLVPYTESVDLSRLVLGRSVASNGESWFTTRALRLAAGHGVRGVVAFADPVPRTRRTPSGPVTITPGHAGTVYQACNAVYTGLATPRTLIVLPDATVLNARAVAKVTGNERGARGVIARLVALGAQPPDDRQLPREWLAAALHAIGATRLRHPGNHRCLIRIGTPARRRRTVIGLSACAYPKRHQPGRAVRAAVDAVAGEAR